MKKYKCNDCGHEADVKGFCPVDGKALVEFEAKQSDDAVSKLLNRIGDLVEEKTKEALNGLDLDGAPKKGILPNEKSANAEDRLEYTKGLLTDSEQKLFNACETEKEEKAFLVKARQAHFFKNMLAFQVSKDPEYLAHVKALAEGTDGAGGYLVPTEFRASLVRDLKDKGFLRGLATVIPMTTDTMDIPTLTSDVQTSWGSENTTISTTTARFGTLQLTPFRLNTFMYTSRELVADSAIGVIQLITTLFVEAIGRAEDTAIVNGSGSGQPKGILQETLGGIDNANVDADLADNIKKLPYKLNKAYRTNARWLANGLAVQAIATLKDSNNQYLLNTLAEGTVTKLAGLPLEEQNDMPVDTLLLGDMKFYYIGDREKVSVETTTEGAGTFEKHQVAIKIVERIDGKVALTNAFKTLTNCGID